MRLIQKNFRRNLHISVKNAKNCESLQNTMKLSRKISDQSVKNMKGFYYRLTCNTSEIIITGNHFCKIKEFLDKEQTK